MDHNEIPRRSLVDYNIEVHLTYRYVYIVIFIYNSAIQQDEINFPNI